MVPVMFEAWGQATSLVLSESSVFSSLGSQTGFLGSEAAHHLTVKPRRSATCTQGAVLASWFNLDRTNSSPGWNLRAVDRLCRSWVVETPILIYVQDLWVVSCILHPRVRSGLPLLAEH
jgi:hypothetical protein